MCEPAGGTRGSRLGDPYELVTSEKPAQVQCSTISKPQYIRHATALRLASLSLPESTTSSCLSRLPPRRLPRNCEFRSIHPHPHDTHRHLSRCLKLPLFPWSVVMIQTNPASTAPPPDSDPPALADPPDFDNPPDWNAIAGTGSALRAPDWIKTCPLTEELRVEFLEVSNGPPHAKSHIVVVVTFVQPHLDEAAGRRYLGACIAMEAGRPWPLA